MYADDTTLILSDERSIQQSFKLVERYGAKLNQQKTNGVFLGKWKHKSPGPVDISWVTSAKIVGLFFGYNNPKRKTWVTKLNEIKESTKAWDDSGLTMKGKAAVVNNFILSKLWYTAEVIPPPKDIIRKINRVIFIFLWGHTTE